MTAKEIVATQSKELAVMDYSQFAGSGASEDIDGSDIIIPQMLLMQGLSNLVTSGEARVGEIRDSLSGELLGDKNGPPKVLIFGVKKTWEEHTIAAGQTKEKWTRSIPVTISNAGLPKVEEHPNGSKTVRYLQYNFTCLYTGRDFIEKETPYMVSFRSYSVRPAQRLCSHFTRLEKHSRPSYSQVIELVPTDKENEKGKFPIFDWRAGRDATMEEMQACHAWRKRLAGVDVVAASNPTQPQAPVANDDDDTIPF